MPPAAPNPGQNPFDNPLKAWGNDDLLLKTDQQIYFKTHHAQVFRVLDWPDMRVAFTAVDAAAGHGKRRSHRLGLLAVVLAGLGVILGAIAALSGPALIFVSALSALLTFAGGALALWHVMFSRLRMEWLSNRFWTERTRQFHFQFLINNLDSAVHAMQDDAALADYTAARARAFADMSADARHTAERIACMERDMNETRVWLRPEWAEPLRRPAASDQLSALLLALYHLRIRVQDHYARLALLPGAHSPATRAAFFQWIGDICTALVVVLAFFAGLALVPFGHMFSAAQPFLWAGVGVFSAVGLMMRALEQGLQTSFDHERYEWYLASVEAIAAQFTEGNTATKIDALRKMEALSYQELRRFIIAHRRAKFLM